MKMNIIQYTHVYCYNTYMLRFVGVLYSIMCTVSNVQYGCVQCTLYIWYSIYVYSVMNSMAVYSVH